MATFTPPADNFVVPAIIQDVMSMLPISKEERLANKLGVHIEASGRGRNIFLLANGTYTERQPSDYTLISKVYYGGHSTEVDAAEVASLTAAGYGAYIS
jgi:hypothetical protein